MVRRASKTLKSLIFNLKSVNGQALLIATVLIGVMVVFGFITVSNTMHFNRVINIIDERAAAKEAAEAGLAKAIWCLNQSSGDNCGGTYGASYAGESDIFLGNTSFTTNITDKDASTKTIASTGYYPSSTSTRTKIVVKQEASIHTDSVSFHFGAQVGDGGMIMEGGSRVEGNVYSNGNIKEELGWGATIAGDVYVAGGTSPLPDQQHTAWSGDFIFGKSSDPNKYDIAQSFKPSITEKLNKVSFYIKKIGNPSSVNVKIVTNHDGEPTKTVLSYGTLNAFKVTSSYYWVDVSMFYPPQLSAGATYWVIIDANNSSSNYWSIKFDSSDAYPNGTGKYSPNWNAYSPVWANAGGDFNFKTYMGGSTTFIDDVTVTGDAYANTIDDCNISGDSYSKLLKYSSVGGNASSDEISWSTVGYNASSTYIFYSTIGHDAYCQVISGSTVGWHTYCPSSVTPPEDPAPKDMPISEGQINEWKGDASVGDPIEGDYEPTESIVILGPKKINGNFHLEENGQHLILTGGLYVTGNLEISNGASITLDPTFGQNSSFIIVDGTIHLENNGDVGGSGDDDSTLLLVALASGGGHHDSAVDIHNRAEGAVFYAPNGMIYLHNNVHVTELTAKKIYLNQNAVLDYDIGLIDTNFTSGPGGAWGLKKGTWRIIK